MDDPSLDLAPAMDTLRAEVAEWRMTRTHRGAPMPARLWAAAVGLARRHGLAPTARAVDVDYGSLKRRLAATTARPLTKTTFLDLGVAPPAGVGACVLVVEGARSRRLRVELSDLRVPDLVALVRAAWGLNG
jgi:hypothetical protein